MAVRIPFPLPAVGYALNSKVRINLDFLVDQFNQFNTGTATWDNVSIGTANSADGSLTFYNEHNSNYLTFKPGTTAANTNYTLPPTLPAGTADKYLTSTDAGVMSWDSLNLVGSISGTTNQITVADDGDGTVTLATPQNIHTAADVEFQSLTVANSLAGPAASIRFAGSLTSGFFLTQNNPLSDSRINLTLEGGNACNFGTVYSRFNSRLEVYESDATNGGIHLLAADSPYHAVFKMQTYDGLGAGPGNCYIYTTDGFNYLSFGYKNGTGFSVTSSTDMSSDVHFNSTSAGIQLPAGNTLALAGATSGTVGLDAPSTITNYSFTLPTTGGTATYVLQTDGAGNTSWIDPTTFAPAGGATTALDNLASIAINTSLISDTDNIDDLGDATHDWKDIYFQGSLKSGAATLATATEISYISGVTSSVQTQLGLKAPLASPTFTGTVTMPLTASKVVVTGVASDLVSSATTAVELSYVGGVTSSIQTQLGTKLETVVAGDVDAEASTDGYVLTSDGAGNAAWEVIGLPGSGATTELDNLGTVAINTDLISDTDNTDDLGTSTKSWKTGYFGTSVVSGTLTLAAGSITDSSGAISFGNENLVTTGTLGCGALTAGSTLTVADTSVFTGDVGIGSSPSYKFHVIDTNLTDSQFKIQGTGGGCISSFIYSQDELQLAFDSDYTGSANIARDASSFIIQKTGNSMVIRGNTGLTPGSSFTPTSRITMDLSNGNTAFSGNVGIGRTSAGHQLHVESEATPTASTLRVNPAAGGGGVALSCYAADNCSIAFDADAISSVWTARDTSAFLVYKTNDKLQITANAGLTPGSSFTPSYKISVDTSGNLNIDGLTASRAIVTDASKNLASSAITSTELGYLDGASSNIQDQIDALDVSSSIFFQGNQSVESTDCTGNGTVAPVAFNSQAFDTGSDFVPGSAAMPTAGVFTAPTTGYYQLNVSVASKGYTAGQSHTVLTLTAHGATTTNKQYINLSSTEMTNHISNIFYMTASSTASATLTVSGGVKGVDIVGDSTQTYFSGTFLGS